MLFLLFCKWIDTERLNIVLCIRVITRRIRLTRILHVVVEYARLQYLFQKKQFCFRLIIDCITAVDHHVLLRSIDEMREVTHIREKQLLTRVSNCLGTSESIPCFIFTLTLISFIKNITAILKVLIRIRIICHKEFLCNHITIYVVWRNYLFLLFTDFCLRLQNVRFDNVSTNIFLNSILLTFTSQIVIVFICTHRTEDKHIISKRGYTILDNVFIAKCLSCIFYETDVFKYFVSI